MDKNLLANSGDTCLGRSLVPKDSICHRANKPVRLEPMLHKRNHHSERPQAPQRRVAPACRNWKKPACDSEDPAQPKNKSIKFLKKQQQWRGIFPGDPVAKTVLPVHGVGV